MEPATELLAPSLVYAWAQPTALQAAQPAAQSSMRDSAQLPAPSSAESTGAAISDGIESLFHPLVSAFSDAHTWAFENLVQPLLFLSGSMHLAEEAFLGTELALVGTLQIIVFVALLRPLEALTPAEPRSDHAAIRTDIIYTFLTRLGLLPLLFFFILLPLEGLLDSVLHSAGLIRPTLETLIPPLALHPLAAFFCYLAVLDLIGYWIHRAQHRFAWWWALHAVHHSQRQLTFWSDTRNHVADELLVALLTALAVRLIGVPPGQFIVLTAAVAMIEHLSHANTRLHFGRLGERLLVSPRFHRWHHAIGDGHEGTYRGINFAVLLPLWDRLFRTADFRAGTPPTGIRDQLDGADYGQGWWAQQWLGFERMWHALAAHPAK